MNKSKQRRIAAFLSGSLAFFSGGFSLNYFSIGVAAIIMIIGAIVSGVIGYHFWEILGLFQKSYHKAVNWHEMFTKKKSTSRPSVFSTLRKKLETVQKIAREVGSEINELGKEFLSWIAPIFTTPFRFPKWLKDHPANIAIFIDGISKFSCMGFNVLLIAVLGPWANTPEAAELSGKALFNSDGMWLLTIFMAMIPLVALIVFDEKQETKDPLTTVLFKTDKNAPGQVKTESKHRYNSSRRYFYQMFDIYMKNNGNIFKIFIRQFLASLTGQLLMLIRATFFVLYWLVSGLPMLACVSIPVFAFMAFMMGFYRISIRSDHWWYIGTSILISGISLLVFHGLYESFLPLVCLSLFNGLICLAIVETAVFLGKVWEKSSFGARWITTWLSDKPVFFSIAGSTWKNILHRGKMISEKFESLETRITTI